MQKKGANAEEGKKAKFPPYKLLQEWHKEAEETLGRRLTQEEVLARWNDEDVETVKKRLDDQREINQADDVVDSWDN